MARRRKTFLRTGHGAGKGTPHVELPPADEQSPAVHASAATVPLTFRSDGRIADSETARELGRRGGTKTAQRVRLVDSLGLATIAESADFAKYRTSAEAFVAHHVAELARIAGGKVGSGPSTMVASAALQLAASRFCFDRGAQTGDVAMLKLGSSLANDSRQNLIAARETAIRDAEGYVGAPEDDPMYVAPEHGR